MAKNISLYSKTTYHSKNSSPHIVEHMLGQKFPDASNKLQIHERNLYKRKIESMDDSAIHKLHLQNVSLECRMSEEEWLSRMMNSPLSVPDMDYYCKLPRWDFEIASALAFSKTPQVIHYHGVIYHQHLKFSQDYVKVLTLILEATKHGELERAFTPLAFVLWAKKKNISLPRGMEKLIKRYSVDCIDNNTKSEAQETSCLTGVGAELPYIKIVANLLKLCFGKLASKTSAEHFLDELSGLYKMPAGAEIDARIKVAKEVTGSQIKVDTIRKILKKARSHLEQSTVFGKTISPSSYVKLIDGLLKLHNKSKKISAEKLKSDLINNSSQNPKEGTKFITSLFNDIQALSNDNSV